MAQSVFSNATVATGGRVFNAALGLVVTALITRGLGPAGFGAYALLLSYAVLLQLAADFGLYLTLTREIAQQPDREQHYLTQTLSLRASLFVVGALVGLLAAYFIPSLTHLLWPLLIVMVGLFFQSLSQLLLGVYQTHAVVWRATVADLVGRAVQILIVVTALFTSITLITVTIAFTIAAAATLWVQRQLLPSGRPSFFGFEWKTWKHFLTISWPLGLMLVLNAIYFRIDTLILSLFRSSAEVGLYGLAYRLIESGLFFPAMLGGLLLPKLSAALGRSDTRLARAYLQESQYVLLAAIIPIVFVLAVIPEHLIALVSGVAYAQAAPLLRVLSIALAVMFFGNIFGFTLVALRRHTALLMLYGGLVVFNTLGNMLFIPQWGSLAAAWTTVATEAVATVVAALLVARALPFRIVSPNLTALLAALAAAALVFIVLGGLVPPLGRAAAALAVYGVGLLVTGALNQSRLPLLRHP